MKLPLQFCRLFVHSFVPLFLCLFVIFVQYLFICFLVCWFGLGGVVYLVVSVCFFVCVFVFFSVIDLSPRILSDSALSDLA